MQSVTPTRDGAGKKGPATTATPRGWGSAGGRTDGQLMSATRQDADTLLTRSLREPRRPTARKAEARMASGLPQMERAGIEPATPSLQS